MNERYIFFWLILLVVACPLAAFSELFAKECGGKPITIDFNIKNSVNILNSFRLAKISFHDGGCSL